MLLFDISRKPHYGNHRRTAVSSVYVELTRAMPQLFSQSLKLFDISRKSHDRNHRRTAVSSAYLALYARHTAVIFPVDVIIRYLA
jgi:hypothetical protein